MSFRLFKLIEFYEKVSSWVFCRFLRMQYRLSCSWNPENFGFPVLLLINKQFSSLVEYTRTVLGNRICKTQCNIYNTQLRFVVLSRSDTQHKISNVILSQHSSFRLSFVITTVSTKLRDWPCTQCLLRFAPTQRELTKIYT